MMLIRRSPEQRRFGRRYGNCAKRPSLENVFGKEVAGSAKAPPIAGPMIVPTDQIKGIML